MLLFHKSVFGFASLVILSPCLRADTVAGKVVGPDGQPVAATVYYQNDAGWASSQTQVKSAADGSFRFEVEPSKQATVPVAVLLAAKERGMVAAYAPGYSLAMGYLMANGETTLKLTPPRKISGVLRDEKGTPAANATLRFLYFFQSFGTGAGRRHLFLTPPASLLPQFSTKTDAEGKWSIVGAPAQATVHVQLDDDNYVQDSAQINGDGETEGPGRGQGLVAQRAGRISGRVLDEKGAPVKGVQVTANLTGEQNGRHGLGGMAFTDKDGIFRISRVSPGTYVLMTSDLVGLVATYGRASVQDVPKPTRRIVAPALENVRVEAGKVAQNNALRLVAPAIVKGRVVEKGTGKPLSGVSVGAYGKAAPLAAGALPSTRTDSQGLFEMAVVPGSTTIYAYETNYWSSGQPEGVTTTVATFKAGQNPVLTLPVKRRLADLEGQVVNEDGTPAGGVEITVWNSHGTGQSLVSDDKGQFSVKRMDIGTLRLDPRSEWTVIKPKSFVSPVAAPLKIVVRRNKMAKVSGRVVDASGKPVQGVKMRFTMPIETYEGQNARAILSPVTDEAGQFVFEALKMPEALQLKLDNVSKKGFSWRRGGGEVGEAKAQDTAVVLSDIVMDSLGGTLKGVATTGAGQVAAGILVRSSGDDFENMATTDAAGHFELDDQPQGEVELLAAQGRAFGRVKVHGSDANAKIVLSPGSEAMPRSVEQAVVLFREMAPAADGRTIDEAAVALVPYQPATALELMLLVPEIKPDQARLRLIDSLHPGVGDETLTWAQQELPQITGDTEFVRAGAKLGLLLAARQPEAAKAVFGSIEERRAKLKGEPAIQGTAWVAALAGRLELPEASQLYDEALALALRDPRQLSSLVEPLAAGTATLAEAALEELPPNEKNIYQYRLAVQQVARYDVPGARRLLEQMRELVDAVPQLPTENGQYRGRDSYEFDWAFAAKDVLRAMNRSEAGAATQIAERVQGWHRPSALALAAEFGTKEQRLAMMEQTVAAENRGPWMENLTLPRLGALATELDPAKATDLFTRSAQQMGEERRKQGEGYSTDWSFYASFWNPAQGRLALEADWAHLMQKAEKGKDDHYQALPWNQAALTMAMGAIDLDRALEWAHQISDKPSANNPSPRARALEFIGEMLLQEPAQRRLLVISPESGYDS